jgi:hypothetical protein
VLGNMNIQGRSVRLASEEEGEEAAYTQYDRLTAGQQPIEDNAPVVAILERLFGNHRSKLATVKMCFRTVPPGLKCRNVEANHGRKHRKGGDEMGSPLWPTTGIIRVLAEYSRSFPAWKA